MGEFCFIMVYIMIKHHYDLAFYPTRWFCTEFIFKSVTSLQTQPCMDGVINDEMDSRVSDALFHPCWSGSSTICLPKTWVRSQNLFGSSRLGAYINFLTSSPNKCSSLPESSLVYHHLWTLCYYTSKYWLRWILSIQFYYVFLILFVYIVTSRVSGRGNIRPVCVCLSVRLRSHG